MTIYPVNNIGSTCSNCQKRPATLHVARTPYGDVCATFPLCMDERQTARVDCLLTVGCTVECECDQCRTAMVIDADLEAELQRLQDAVRNVVTRIRPH